jgi:periplasmic protein TonB
MRVLVVDQDSASNEAIARSLRDLYTVDAVTNKGDCLDLLRSNTFEVIVAAERLEDGSGLELLGQVARKWPAVLRVFAADPQRLRLLKGRLGPFGLFQTLGYPIDPDRLIAALNLADPAQNAHADTSNTQHVVLSGEPPPQPDDLEVPEEAEESEDFPAPRPAARVAPVEREERNVARAASVHRARSSPGQRPRRNGAGGPPTTRTTSTSLAARIASHTSESGRPPRHGRSWTATHRAPPVQFPPIAWAPPAEPSQAPRSAEPGDPLAEAAAMVRMARSNDESPAENLDSRRVPMLVGGGAAALLVVLFLGFRIFGAQHEAPKSAARPMVNAPQHPQAVTDLVTQIEAAFTADDFKRARTDVEELRKISPSHPRLPFFESLLAKRADLPAKGVSAGRGVSKHTQTSRHETSGMAAQPPSAAPSPPQSVVPKTPSGSVPGTPSEAASETPSRLAPETPASFSRAAASAESTVASGSASATQSAPSTTISSSAVATPGMGAASDAAVASGTNISSGAGGSSNASSAAGASPTPKTTSDEPPPVVREARLIHRVSPDYPSGAKKDGIEGSVDLEITVSAQGVVENASVVRSTPPAVFDKSAIAAVRRWKYDPRYVDGLPSVAHLTVHLDFTPDN